MERGAVLWQIKNGLGSSIFVLAHTFSKVVQHAGCRNSQARAPKAFDASQKGLRDAADSYSDTVLGSHAWPQTVSPRAETSCDALVVLAELAPCRAA